LRRLLVRRNGQTRLRRITMLHLSRPRTPQGRKLPAKK
jgi:hypothetical protein